MIKSEKNCKMKEKIIKKLKDKLTLKNEIIFCYIHGSFLDGILFNDIDVAVYVDPEKIGLEKAFDYSFNLSVELTKEIGLDIDVQIMNYSTLGFKHYVFKNGRLLFSKDENLRLELMEKISLEYIDFYELSLQYIRELIY